MIFDTLVYIYSHKMKYEFKFGHSPLSISSELSSRFNLEFEDRKQFPDNNSLTDEHIQKKYCHTGV